MFKHSLIILKNALIVSTVMFIFGIMVDEINADPAPCYGIGCDAITCPDGYQIKVEPDKYVKCEDLEAYIKEYL